MTKENYKSDINFLFEMGNIRHIDRLWKRFLGNTAANVAEHHFRAFWIAMIISSREKGVDTGKIAKMILVHDIAESRTGDADYLSRQYVERNEELGIKDMLDKTSLENEFLALWNEYQQKETLEAKIVKDADNLEVDFEMAEQASQGSSISIKWHKHRKLVAKGKLYTKTAKEIFKQLENVEPHDWHLSGRNRLNKGDWQDLKENK